MEKLLHEVKDLLGIALSSGQIAAFEKYHKELNTWNQRINLTGIHDPVEVRRKLFLDSLSCLLAMEEARSQKVVDVGSGAGFPGIPIKILFPEMQLTLVEATKKKAAFLSHMVDMLSLSDVEVYPERVERFGQNAEHRETFDWVLARSVARMPVLVEFLLPLVRVGGRMLAQKGANAREDLQEAENAIGILGGEFERIIPVAYPGLTVKRNLVVIRKVEATPDKYPRREGMPAKRPL